MPPALAQKMAQALNGVLAQSEVQSALLRQGYTTRPMNPEQYTTFVRDEMVKWGDLARAAGLQAS